MRRALLMMAGCAALAGCVKEPERPVAHNYLGSGVFVAPYVDQKTGTEWLVFTYYQDAIAVVPRHPIPAPPKESPH